MRGARAQPTDSGDAILKAAARLAADSSIRRSRLVGCGAASWHRSWCRAPLAGRSMIGVQLIEESDIVPCIVHIVAVHIVPRYGPCRDSGAPCCGNRKLRLTAVPHRGQSTELGRTSLLSHRTVSTVSLLLSVSGALRRWVGGRRNCRMGLFCTKHGIIDETIRERRSLQKCGWRTALISSGRFQNGFSTSTRSLERKCK